MKKILWILGSLLMGCQSKFLEEKPNKALLVPTTVADFRALLNNMATGDLNIYPGLNTLADDDFVAQPSSIQSLSEIEQKAYLWKSDVFGSEASNDWNKPYGAIFIANVVLDGIPYVPVTPDNQAEIEQLKGEAYFHRAFALYGLLQQFAAPYQAETAPQELGLPIRLTANVNVLVGRGNLQQAYDQVLSDLDEAALRLAERSVYRQRPSRWGVEGLRARVYLTMGRYDLALVHATACLERGASLLDYQKLDTLAVRPMPRWEENPEIIFYSQTNPYLFHYEESTQLEAGLYASYQTGDLRRACFFTPDRVFKGSYSGSSGFSGSLTTGEVLLTRAECYARLGQNQASLTDLNTLLQARFLAVHFQPYRLGAVSDVLDLVLRERRKELVARGLRWADLRRLNLESRWQKTLERVDDQGQRHALKPNDPRYTFPIPTTEIQASGIAQNPR
ncbi:RagB/SusD family nutrient uptake outer membrane protein [Siphonobacter curvatus]|uniref:RagB/SusD family nutrient uptake outer membrane protein n=1 Tax=Siphonobacter curvatus TaxID=2094562 RepID=A0A2S7IEN4_9BACT|nr:RagB/SusD family nutrient uptake outer membrane protein [Siphonobacter curvatus]PQA53224.1 RagB/SusD family nutrient uptake outer membrane protein [Siphonobacter curvatus]